MKRFKKRENGCICIIICLILLVGCGKKQEINEMDVWLSDATLEAEETSDELYEKALLEDTLVIYSVSSRVFEVKESFEQKYKGLTVDVKDIRGNDVVDMVRENYESGKYDCDLILCSDCDGSLYKELLETGIIYSYVPWDIASVMKENHADIELDFLGEAMMLFYNNVFDEQPIENIWELTQDKYKGKIIMASPLSSFSTYGYCSAMFSEEEALKKAYLDYFGKELDISQEKSAGEFFWEMVSPNIIFTNSSDEVLEGIGKSGNDMPWIGIMISSKMRYQDLGYSFTPIYHLNPFAAVYTPNCISIVGGCKNVNSAKLFVRYLLGENDGTGIGYKPFSTSGTWSTRTDVADGNEVPLSDIDYVNLNKEYIYEYRDSMKYFWERLLQENIN